MKEAFDNIIERLGKRLKFYENRFEEMNGTLEDVEDWGSIKSYKDAIEIVNQVTEEYAEKEFSEWCHDCPAYDKENHHCPRLCKVIRTVVEEIKEENNSKWIPISSGNLPDENTKVWCINSVGETMSGYVRWSQKLEDFMCLTVYDYMSEVVAWMPIPEFKQD